MKQNWLRRIAVLLLAALLLPGCTATFAYNRLDWLIPWWVDGYVDISREQRKLLQAQLEPTLDWHRKEELARYDEWLAGISGSLDSEIRPGQVREWMDDVISAAERIEESMLAVAVDFGATVTDEQVAEFTDSLWEQQSEYEEEFLHRSEQEYVDDNAENLAEFAERLIGRLSPQQRKALQMAAHDLQRFDTAWLAERGEWLETLERLLQREPGWQQAIMAAWQERQARRTPEYNRMLAHNLDIVGLAYAELLNGMSPEQRNHAQREIRKYRKKLAKLRT